MGSRMGTGVASGIPTRSPSGPPLTARASTPKAAALASRFMTTALSGTTTERNTIISSRNDTSSTPPKKSGSRSATPRVMSRLAATIPPTSTLRPVPAIAAGTAVVTQGVDQVCGGLVLRGCGGDHPQDGGVAGLVHDGRLTRATPSTRPSSSPTASVALSSSSPDAPGR